MFSPRQYRARANEYSILIKGTDKPAEIREFQKLEHGFTELADNGEWMATNWDKTVFTGEALSDVTLTEEEGRILSCLGASVICTGTLFLRICRGSFWTMPAPRETCCRQVHSGSSWPAFCTNTKMTKPA